MDYHTWTLRQKAKVAVPVVIAASFALQNAACSRSFEYEVRNDASVPFIYRDAHDCQLKTSSDLRRETWDVVLPGAQQEAYTFGWPSCLMVATPDLSEIETVDFKADALYLLTEGVGGPLIERVGGRSPDDEGTVFSVLFVIPFLLGMLGAAFVSIRYFYRYYVLGDKTAHLDG